MYAFYLGNCLVSPCVVLFVGFLPYVANMHARVRMEESHLERIWGDGFRDYASRVPRYLPFRARR
jgi:protein-S-isoprenylcysteine O-methyltransferase Ste14